MAVTVSKGMRMNKKSILQILLMVLASVLIGLGSNFFAHKPLPLFREMPSAAPAVSVSGFSEADVDFVRQFSADPGVVLLDARTVENFEHGHIPGAASLPISRFDEFFPRQQEHLRAARMLIVYCSDLKCPDSHELALRLFRKGLKVLFLYKGGMEDWLENGNAVEK
ncbi:MAG: rhodanese-like domain-containing protein [Acidobacteria bacterium]|nr:rhodanese-like domain-containing protein [Acidobacteriota bacterium]MBU4404377.1 rhodanese-like domain-containing protein [Acidobacteriota bacterium]MCG2809995.1 rhodanese-like domain-containing protein [Candidatus Aminicenantes bacterium]